MINRFYIQCVTCQFPYTLRISVGNNSLQEHVFKCQECLQEIKVALDVDFKNISTSLRYIENCIKGENEGTIINLHPDFVLPKETLNQDQYFPNLIQGHEIIKMHEQFGQLQDYSLQDLKERSKKHLGLADRWNIINKAWSFYNNGKEDFLTKHLSSNFGDDSKDFKEHLFEFLALFVNMKGRKLFDGVMDICQQIRNNNPTKYEKFIKYFQRNLLKDHLLHSYDILKEFFDNFSDFNQTLIYSTVGIPFREDFEATSTNFEKTKMFYGNAYEVFTDHLITLALINNLLNRRDFDKFETLTLKKYKTLDKANRCGPFRNNPTLMEFSNCLDSQLRNASHHRKMTLDWDNKVINYLNKSGSAKTIPYVDYLLKCSDIIVDLSTLLMIELVFDYIGPDE